jgi:hypothetical protein
MNADMKADCAACAPTDAKEQPSRVRAKVPWLSFLPAVLYAIAPKCPICLAAYLSVCGITVSAAGMALSVLGPIAAVSAVMAIAFVLWRTKLGRARA